MRNPLCWLVRRRLDAYQDGELSPAARARTAGHLARCAGCAAEVEALQKVAAALAVEAPEPGEAVWDAFWPQVRARMAAAGPVEDVAALRPPAWSRGLVLGPGRLALGSALAAAALAIVVVAPWKQPAPITPEGPVSPSVVQTAPGVQTASVVVQSVETTDPESSVMVFSNDDADVTVVWVFGLERTEI
jgi:anti-sigma factor RsiW